MEIASWNVNSIKARIERVLEWLDEAKPDVVCLQELKTVDEGVPLAAFEERGYNVVTHGQKSYNGVAILSKMPFEEVNIGLPGDDTDEQARYIEVVVAGENGPVRIVSLYLPNGNPVIEDGVLGPKFLYKLSWMERLRLRAKELLTYEEPLILAGDYNVIPTLDDVYDPILFEGDALFMPQSLAAFNAIKWIGLTSAYEQIDGRPHQYTYWGYQGGAWPKNHGVRIDHLLLSGQAVDQLMAIRIDSHVRDREKPSDHVPIIGSFGL